MLRALSRYFTPVYVPVQVEVLKSSFSFTVQPPLPLMALNFPVPPVISNLVLPVPFVKLSEPV